MATTTFYPNAVGEGYLGVNDASWYVARSSSSAAYADSEGTYAYVSSFKDAASTLYVLRRETIPFDTSLIPDNNTVTAAQLKVYVLGVSASGNNTNGTTCVVQSSQAINTDIELADYRRFGLSEGANRQPLTSTGWKTFDLNATGIGWVSKTGYTKLGLRTSLDVDNTTPVDTTNETSFWIASAEDATYKPQLIVTYDHYDRYWVGGSGNWSDTSHWAISSGGSGGYPVPTSTESVHFDSNSFTGAGQKVTVNTEASCLNMDWTGATNTPDLAGGQTINIYGTLTTIAEMTWTHNSNLYLRGNAEYDLTSNGISMSCNLYIINGTWTLQDDLTINNIFISEYDGDGGINTNGKTVNVVGFHFIDSSGVITLGASTINCSGHWDMDTGYGLTLNVGTSTINISGDYFYGAGKTYNIVNLQSNQSIHGNNTFDTLALTAGKEYTFTADSTQTIISTFTADGTSGNLISLLSSEPGTKFTITKATGNVTCSFIDIRDCAATGGVTWTANSSFDNGNNSGWIFPDTKYWVGGSGNTNNTAHWADSSGGAGGASLPDETYNVVFDSNSGFTPSSKTVTINDGGLDCLSMTWSNVTNNPILTNNDAGDVLNINGSINLTDNMVIDFYDALNFYSDTGGNTINIKPVFSNINCISFYGSGEWTLLNDLVMTISGNTNEVDVYNGTLNTNGKTIICRDFYADNRGTAVINLGNSTIDCYDAWNIELSYGGSLDLNSETSTIQLEDATWFDGAGLEYYNLTIADGASNIEIYSSNTFYGTISIPANSIVAFENGKTQTLGEDAILLALGTSGNLCVLKSLDNGVQFTLSKSSGSVTVQYCSIRDSNATGGAIWQAQFSENYDNNTGWDWIFNTAYFFESLKKTGGFISGLTNQLKGVLLKKSGGVLKGDKAEQRGVMKKKSGGFLTGSKR